jgi:hypothetical protein
VGPGEVPYLAVPRSKKDGALRMLRNLHEMMKSGVLSGVRVPHEEMGTALHEAEVVALRSGDAIAAAV